MFADLFFHRLDLSYQRALTVFQMGVYGRDQPPFSLHQFHILQLRARHGQMSAAADSLHDQLNIEIPQRAGGDIDRSLLGKQGE